MARSYSESGADQPTAPVSLTQWVADVIAERIIQGRYAEGHHLREQELVAELDVSRSPIREALRILERDGYVEIMPRRGAVVTVLSEKMVDDIYKCRRHLTALVAEEATPNLTPADLDCLERLLSRMKRAVDTDDVSEYYRCNSEFHNLLWERSCNVVLQQILRTLAGRVLRLRYLSVSLPSRARASLQAHELLVRAFRSRDGAEAGRISATLIDEARLALLEHLRSRPTLPDEAADGLVSQNGAPRDRLPPPSRSVSRNAYES